MATLQTITDAGNKTSDDIVFINPITKKEVIRISPTADSTLFTVQFNNQALHFSYKDGSSLDLANYHVELYNKDASLHTLLGTQVSIFETPAGRVIIRDGIIILTDKVTGNELTISGNGINK